MRALVSGAGGFVGAHLTARLVAEGWAVTAMHRPGSPPWRLEALGVAGEVRLLAHDLSLPSPPGDLAGFDAAFLLAASRARGTAAERASTTAVNALAAARLIEELGPCPATVVLGSSTEYGQSDGPMGEGSGGRPRGFFGATKAAGSLLALATAAEVGSRAVVCRAFGVYGPLDHPGRLVPAALAAARCGRTLPLTTPGLRRDWIYVDDVVAGCMAAAESSPVVAGEVLNLGTGVQVANEELVALVEQVSGRPVTVEVGAHPGRNWDTSSWVADATRARHLMGWWARVDLEEGLSRCWRALGE